jgi:hypothetical protein
MSRKFKSLLNLTTLSSDPLGSEGDVFFNTTEKALKIHNGNTWVTLVKSDDPTPFYMHTHNYDGDVDSVFPVPLTVDQIGEQGFLTADAGNPTSIPTPYPSEGSTIDGGTIV